MKKINMKSKLLLIAVAAIMLVTVGGTLAYLIDVTDPVTNTFKPTSVETTPDETWTGTEKSDVHVDNTGDVPVYVRAKLVANWVDANGNVVAAWNGSVSYNTSAWDVGSDGYYYHMAPVAVGGRTSALYTGSISYSANDIPAGADHLVVTIIHQSVQAEPIDAVRELWSVNTAPSTEDEDIILISKS